MKKFILSALVAMVLVACAKEEAPINKIEEVKNPYAVTPDEAVQLLKTVIGGESTRAVTIGDIKTLRKSDFVPTTRGGEDGDLIYIVDLENGGSAVMGADKRMEPIYAILDETKISPEKLTQTATRGDGGEEDIEDFVMGALSGSIQIDLMGMGDLIIPEMPIVPIPQYVTVTTQLDSKSPILDTKWGWVAPYIDMLGSGNSSVDNAIIALAQFYYFHRLPNSLGSYSFNWDLIAECEYGQTPSLSAKNEVAKLFYAITQNGGSANSMTNYGVCTMVEKAGFDPSNFGGLGIPYRPNKVKEKNDQNKLVFGYGITAGGDAKYWLFDGYKFYREDVYYRVYDPAGSGSYTDTLESSTTYNLCHCNFGYSGVCDGYYPMDVFDLTTRLANKNINSSVGDIAGTQTGVNLVYNLYTMSY